MRSLALAPGARMRPVIDTGEVLEVQVRIDLGRADAGVAEHFLYRPQVTAGFQQVAGKAVSQHVGVKRALQLLSLSGQAKPLLNCPPAEAPAMGADKQGALLCATMQCPG